MYGRWATYDAQLISSILHAQNKLRVPITQLPCNASVSAVPCQKDMMMLHFACKRIAQDRALLQLSDSPRFPPCEVKCVSILNTLKTRPVCCCVKPRLCPESVRAKLQKGNRATHNTCCAAVCHQRATLYYCGIKLSAPWLPRAPSTYNSDSSVSRTGGRELLRD